MSQKVLNDKDPSILKKNIGTEYRPNLHACFQEKGNLAKYSQAGQKTTDKQTFDMFDFPNIKLSPRNIIHCEIKTR